MAKVTLLEQHQRDLVAGLAAAIRAGQLPDAAERINLLSTAEPFWHPAEVRALLDATASLRMLDALAERLGPAMEPAMRRILAMDPSARVVLLHLAQRAIDARQPRLAVDYAYRSMALYYDDLVAQSLVIRGYGMLPEEERSATAQSASIDLRGKFCARPFRHFETLSTGEVFMCCSSWLPVPIGNIRNSGHGEIWNSPAAQGLRQSIIDGSFRYCSRMSCPHIQTGRLPDRDRVASGDDKSFEPYVVDALRNGDVRLSGGPASANLAHDRSCNLSCPSCRTEVITAKRSEQRHLDQIRDEVILPMLKNASHVWITGSGDPFGSRHFRDILGRLNPRDYPSLTVDLATNGQLFTEREWAGLTNIHSMISSVFVSIDAADADTYAVLRRGGSFERLMTNMRFLSRLRKEGTIKTLSIALVVQAGNLEEMKPFVELGKSLEVDKVYFSRIVQWGTYSVDEFRRLDVCNPDNPLYPRLLEILADPVFDDPIVTLSNMHRFGQSEKPGSSAAMRPPPVL